MKKICTTCRHFKMVNGMRGCVCPDPIFPNGSSCGCWKNQYSRLQIFKSKVLGRNLRTKSMVT